jgi:hypothetical protein
MVGPVSLRFKYHFQGSRNTNRVDKVSIAISSYFICQMKSADNQPEWAFTNILDQLYEHQAFINDYLQPLTTRAGYDISVKVSVTTFCMRLERI